MLKLVDLVDAYETPVASDWLEEGQETITKCWCVVVTGLLLHSFKTCADKVALRSDVLKWLKILDRPKGNIPRTRLPDALKARADAAVAFNIVM